MSKFDEYWKTVDDKCSSDAVRYFVKPLLRDAFNAGRAIAGKKLIEPQAGFALLGCSSIGPEDEAGTIKPETFKSLGVLAG